MTFMWMHGLSRDIERLVGKEVYNQYGQEILDCLKRDCSEHWDIVRYPDDEEIIAVANAIIDYHNK